MLRYIVEYWAEGDSQAKFEHFTSQKEAHSRTRQLQEDGYVAVCYREDYD